ncbi:TadE/TadG family type IV pilus assembly protein [Polymorphospora sp. NPDC050346]|uniref:TadE/TadG family type IV pilus assembly protein n=1 Tax=Polymorphospora sp. NPDC050346 TaxID=3155780 RepID=UPI0033FDE620
MPSRLPATGRDRNRAWSRLRQRLTDSGGDRGASPIELAILVPAILVLLFASIQVAAIFLARSAALAAAQQAVTAQRMLDAEPGAGQERAAQFLAQPSGEWLVDAVIEPPVITYDDGDPAGVEFTVRGRALSLVPWLDLTVVETAHGTVERFTDE